MSATIAVDAMGGDDAPAAPVAAAALAAGAGVNVVLVGHEAMLRRELAAFGERASKVRVVHAPDAVGMDEKAAQQVRRHRETSLYVGMELVKRGEAGALVTMGNTGAAMATALVVLGRIKGVERPALGAVLPAGDGLVLFLDVGANADARPGHLVQFAYMGSAYLRVVYGVREPRVALLSIGEEPSKGSALVTEAHQALVRAASLRFAGNIESRAILSGEADVVVTDGFTGNVCLKLAEGLVGLIFDEVRAAARSSLRSKAGAALLLPSLRGVRDRLDYRKYGAVPLLGVDGGVFIGHGRSDPGAILGAVQTARDAVERGMVQALGAAMRAADQGAGAPEATAPPL